MKYDILDIYRSKNTVFTAGDISLVWKETRLSSLKARIHYYLKRGKLCHVRKGIYAKDNNYNRLELATKIYTPAYISLETVLQKEGIVFQYYSNIFVISYLSRELICDNQTYTYRKIKDSALANSAGIKEEINYFIASKERAFLDALYLYQDYHFDNLNQIDWDFCRELLPVYGNKNLIKRFDSYYSTSKNA